MKRVFKLLICIIPVLLICGCTKKVTKEIKLVQMEQFIIQKTEDDKIENYTFKNDKYEKITDNNVKDKYLLYYNEKFNTTEYNDSGSILIQKGDKNVKMPDNTEFIKIDDKCSRVFYKSADGDSYSYGVINIDDHKNINVDITLSGNCIDWKDSSTLVFYGVVNNQAALYYYDINTKKAKMAARIDDGFVNYLEVIGDSIYYLVNSYDGSSRMINLSDDRSSSFNIEVPYKNVFDIKSINNTAFIMAGNSERVDLYFITNGKIEKVNYDFPKNIRQDSFLYLKDKDVYFIGLDQENNEGLYLFSSTDNEIQLKSPLEAKNHIAKNN
ncbi:MAG: hypothetical protein SPJ62_16765 [Inconstantimicrobium porci]|uniref:hypothetical protein n=1 Tax=Inconstantimicrobium porci TaxID=2652291 RepID=UPI002A9129C4|nr:hypothetical protein [Inconstantimicrobium porci]MDY5913615.1 hypothetical protein [Inconstantimicrobium porci]